MTELVIIGHGASPVGKGQGTLIDSFDTVIRMHDCDFQNEADYGSKYDYGILPAPWLNKAVSQIKRVPQNGWLLYYLHNQSQVKKAPHYIMDKFVLANEKDIFETLGDMELPPTRGLCALVLAAVYLKPKIIHVVGFDSLFSGICEQYHATHPYQLDEKYIGTSQNARHDFEVENNKVRFISEKFNVEIKDLLCTK